MTEAQRKKLVDSEKSEQGSTSASVHTISLGSKGELLDAHTRQPVEDFSRLISRCKYGDNAAADELADQILETASESSAYQTFLTTSHQGERALILTSHGIYNVPTASALIVQRLAERMNVSLANKDMPGVIVDTPLPSSVIGVITGAEQSLFSYAVIDGLTNYKGCDVIFVDDMLLTQEHEEKISRYVIEECGANSVFFLYGAKLEEESFRQTNQVLERVVANREIDGSLESLLPMLKEPHSFTVVQRLLRTVLHPDNKPKLPNYFKLLPDESLLKMYKAASSADFSLRFNGMYKSAICILKEELIARGWVSPEGTLYRKQKFITKEEFSLAAPHQVAVHRLNSKHDISLNDAQLYSRMKYCDPAAVREVANRMAESILKDEQFRSTIQAGKPLYITSSAYGSVPTASTFLTDQIEQQLLAAGVQVKRIKIERRGQFAKQDFGSLTAEQRQAAMKARKLELDDDTKALISGGTVLLVDDLCATGSHEQSIRKVLEEAGVATMFSAYFVKFTEKLMVNEPDTEEWLNRASAKTPLDFLGWMKDLFTASKPLNQKIAEILPTLTSENRKRWNLAQSKKGGVTLTTQLSVVKGPTGDEVTKLRVELLSSNPAEVRDLIRIRANDQIVGDYQLETDKQVGKSKQTKQAFMVDLPTGTTDISQIRLELLASPEEEFASAEVEEDVNYRVETLLQQLREESWAGRSKIELRYGQTKVVARFSKPFVLDRDTALAHQYQDPNVLKLEGTECQRLQLSITDPEADLLPPEIKVYMVGKTSKTKERGARGEIRNGKMVYAFPSTVSTISTSLICFDDETPHRELELIIEKDKIDLQHSWFVVHNSSFTPKGRVRLKSGTLIKSNPSNTRLLETTKKAQTDQCSPKEALELALESLALNSDDGINSRVNIGGIDVTASVTTQIWNDSQEGDYQDDDDVAPWTTSIFLELEIDTSTFDSELIGSILEITVPQIDGSRITLHEHIGRDPKIRIQRKIAFFYAKKVSKQNLMNTRFTLDNISFRILPSRISVERQNAHKLSSGVFVPQFNKGSKEAVRAQRVLDGTAAAEDNLQVAIQSLVINRSSGFSSVCEIGGVHVQAEVVEEEDDALLRGYDPKFLRLVIKNFDPNIVAQSFLSVKTKGDLIAEKHQFTATEDGGVADVSISDNYLGDLELNIVLPKLSQDDDPHVQIDNPKDGKYDITSDVQLVEIPRTEQSESMRRLDTTGTTIEDIKVALQSIELTGRAQTISTVEVGDMTLTATAELNDEEDDVLYHFDLKITIDGIPSDQILNQSVVVITSKSGKVSESKLVPKINGGYESKFTIYRDSLADLQFDLKPAESFTAKIKSVVAEISSKYQETERLAVYQSPNFSIRAELVDLQLDDLDQRPALAQHVLRSQPTLLVSGKSSISVVGLTISGQGLSLDGYSLEIQQQNQTTIVPIQPSKSELGNVQHYMCYIPVEASNINQILFGLVKT